MLGRLAILGASGHGKVVADAAEAAGWQEVVFFDDAWPVVVKNGLWDVVGATCDLLMGLADFDGVVVAIGNNIIRQDKLDALQIAGGKLVSVVHPNAVVSRYASVGVGSVIFAGAIVNAEASVGVGAILNTNSVVEHDCMLGRGCHVSPGAVLAGGVMISDGVWVGANATIRQLVRVGDGAMVGMSAVVTNDVAPGTTVVGNPARPLPR